MTGREKIFLLVIVVFVTILHVSHIASSLWIAYRVQGLIPVIVQQSQGIRDVHDRVEYLEDWLPAEFRREILVHRFENSEGERSPTLSDVWVPDTTPER